MSEPHTDLFRFVAIRPPALPADAEPAVVIRDRRPFGETYVGQVAARLDGRSHRRLLPALRAAAEADGLVPDVPDTRMGNAMLAVVAVIKRGLAEQTVEGLAEAVTEALGASPEEVVEDDEFAELVTQLWDRLETHYLLNRLGSPANLERLSDTLRATRLVRRLSRGVDFRKVGQLRDVAELTLVLPDEGEMVDPPDPVLRRRAVAQAERDEETLAGYAQTWQQLLDLHRALQIVREVPTTAVETEVRPTAARASGRGAGDEDADADDTGDGTVPAGGRRTATVPRQTIEELPGAAREVVTALPLTEDLNDKPRIVAALEQQLSQRSQQILSSPDPLALTAMPPEAVDVPGMTVFAHQFKKEDALEVEWDPTPILFPWVDRPVIKPLGIGDLKVVKERLLRYKTGEVAHIENVLDGESKERTHRRLDRSEEILTIETESIEETEKDNQTTDRFELKKETEKTIESDMSIDAGVTVSASYGPVELGAYANFAYSTSSSETTRNSQNFARDVVDRSLTKVQKRAREERITKTLHEVEETNQHGIDNSPAGGGHVTGVYRWVDKEYEAQVYNYGKRMIFEFVVPEPASYFMYAQENDPAKKVDVAKPRTLGWTSHHDVTPWNFGDYVQAYNVQGVEPPPPAWMVISSAFDQNGMTQDQATSKSSKDLVLPDGYVARSFGYHWNVWHWDGWHFDVLVGLEAVSGSDSTLSGEDSVVPVSVIAAKVAAYVVNVEVFCERTDRAFELWQLKTFEKVVAAYQAALAMYQDKLKAAEVARGVVIQGRNPGLNDRIVRNELKRQCLTLLTGDDLTGFNAVSGAPPVVDLFEAAEEGSFIQFFEQAFEWEQLTYLCYPYFWARESTWSKRLGLNDVDPRFNQFLQAGAARVVVPVHPAYNDAIVHFVETGVLWDGGTPPHIDDPLFLSIVEELKAATDDLNGAEPEGEPWLVTVPTTLVYLQPDSSLPDYTTT
jgi:hypothetical protein